MINVTQLCNGCGRVRILRFGYHGQPRDIRTAAAEGGWREVKIDTHLCPDCICKAVGVG